MAALQQADGSEEPVSATVLPVVSTPSLDLAERSQCATGPCLEVEGTRMESCRRAPFGPSGGRRKRRHGRCALLDEHVLARRASYAPRRRW